MEWFNVIYKVCKKRREEKGGEGDKTKRKREQERKNLSYYLSNGTNVHQASQKHVYPTVYSTAWYKQAVSFKL